MMGRLHATLRVLGLTLPGLILPGLTQAEPAATATAEAAAEGVRFSIVNTSGSDTLEALTYAGGAWFSKTHMNHMAVLVEHPGGRFLFDTGLGREVDGQYAADMPWWMRPMMTYDPVTPARDQLDAAAYPVVKQIILSHVHWDHASGIADFPEAEIWLRPGDRSFIADGPRGPVMPSQFAHADLKWHEYQLRDTAFLGFPRSLDLSDNKSVVLVGMPGHTPGSTGLYLKTSSGREFLFSGDIVWNAKALQTGAPKMLIARLTADFDSHATQTQIDRLVALRNTHPEVLIVPAHDAAVHAGLNRFPAWEQ